jgi:signal transduction histidine kinase
MSLLRFIKVTPALWLTIVVWLLVTGGLMYFLYQQRLSDNEREFTEQATAAYNELREKISINETVLEGFASMLRLAGDSPTIRQYTAEMRRAYPHIYSVGFQTYVPASEKTAFEMQQRRQGTTDFRIKDFSYEGQRQFHDVAALSGYYPTVFADSGNPDVQKVLGLDQFAVPFLKQALLDSIKTGEARATSPFTLAEGGRGYVLYKAREAIPDFDIDSGKPYHSHAVSILIKTDVLLGFASRYFPNATLQLTYRDIDNESAGDAIKPAATKSHFLNTGSLAFSRSLDDSGQPFTFHIEMPNGLSVWDVALAAALITLMIAVGWYGLRHMYKRHRQRLSNESAFQVLEQERETLEQRVIERTRELNEKTSEIQRLAARLVDLQEDDYRHIARELHDEFGQTITAIGINNKLISNRAGNKTDVTKLTSDTQALVDDLHTSIHSLIGRLRPEAIDTFGLKASIEQCIARFKPDQSGIQVNLNIQDEVDHLPDNHTITIYRAVQELVNNAIKHGNPEAIEITISLEAGVTRIRVADNGSGISNDTAGSGFGLSGLKERIVALRGEMMITNTGQQGCTVTLNLPHPTDFARQVANAN